MGILEMHAMKRIDAMIPSMRRKEVVDSILKAGAQGITLLECRVKVMTKDHG